MCRARGISTTAGSPALVSGGAAYAIIEPIEGHSNRRARGLTIEAFVSPGGRAVVPVCNMYLQLLCSLRNWRGAGWCIVLTIENLLSRCASRGRYSQKLTPGIVV